MVFVYIQLLTCFSCSTFSHPASSHFDDYNYRIFPWIIEPGTIISFFAQKGGDFSREAIIWNIAHWKSCAKYFVLSFPWNHKTITLINWTWAFKCSKFSYLINFQSLNRHWLVLLDLLVPQFAREGIKDRDDGERGGGGAIIRGRRLFWVFPSKGDGYSRKYGIVLSTPLRAFQWWFTTIVRGFARLLTVQFTSNEGMSNDAPYPRRGGCSGFQVTWMIEWGQKPKPQKIPVPKINSKKIPYQIS